MSVREAFKAVDVVDKTVREVITSLTDTLVHQGDLRSEQVGVIKEGIKVLQQFSDEQLVSCANQVPATPSQMAQATWRPGLLLRITSAKGVRISPARWWWMG